MSRRVGMTPRQNFQQDEKVLCFHGELLYEAKILEVQNAGASVPNPFSYRVHYKGWKSTWDDWVEEDRLRKLNDENRELAQSLKRSITEATQKPKPISHKKKGLPSDFGSARGSEERSATTGATGRGQKRGRNMEIDEVGDSYFSLPTFMDGSPEEMELLAAPRPKRRKQKAMEPKEDPPSLQNCYTYLESGLYSPTESLFPYLDQDIFQLVEDEHGGRKIINTMYTPARETVLGNRGSSPDAAKPPQGQRKATTTSPETKTSSSPTPPKSGKTISPPKAKKRRTWSEDEREFDDSPRARQREMDKVENDLLKWVEQTERQCRGSVKEHPDFPHPTVRQTYPKAPPRPRKPRAPPARARKPTNKKQEAAALQEESGVNEMSEMQEEAFHARPMIKIPVPDYIKSLLVDDWEEVTKNLRVVPLPSAKPVNAILDEYYEEEKAKRFEGSADMDLLDEVRQGLKEYFDVSLGKMLLYRFERQQYLEARKCLSEAKGEWKGKSGAGDVYGAEHLCRMIVAMPEMIAQTNMDGQSINRLREEMAKFLQWLSRNTKTYFLAEYETPGQEYLEKTRAGEDVK
ncbi:MAG: hypothetical protein Q9228_003645 [Teloschistes exilis]